MSCTNHCDTNMEKREVGGGGLGSGRKGEGGARNLSNKKTACLFASCIPFPSCLLLCPGRRGAGREAAGSAPVRPLLLAPMPRGWTHERRHQNDSGVLSSNCPGKCGAHPAPPTGAPAGKVRCEAEAVPAKTHSNTRPLNDVRRPLQAPRYFHTAAATPDPYITSPPPPIGGVRLHGPWVHQRQLPGSGQPRVCIGRQQFEGCPPQKPNKRGAPDGAPGLFLWARIHPIPREVIERGEQGGGPGSETQKFVYTKWPDKIFPMVNFVFSHDDHFGLGGGGGQGGRVTPPLLLRCTAIRIPCPSPVIPANSRPETTAAGRNVPWGLQTSHTIGSSP